MLFLEIKITTCRHMRLSQDALHDYASYASAHALFVHASAVRGRIRVPAQAWISHVPFLSQPDGNAAPNLRTLALQLPGSMRKSPGDRVGNAAWHSAVRSEPGN